LTSPYFLVVLDPDLFKHGKVDEEIAALAESRGIASSKAATSTRTP